MASESRTEALDLQAKSFLFWLDQDTLAVYLRMIGALVIAPYDEPVHHPVRNLFPMNDGRAPWFVDARRLGQIWLVEGLSSLLVRLEPEPLTEEI